MKGKPRSGGVFLCQSVRREGAETERCERECKHAFAPGCPGVGDRRAGEPSAWRRRISDERGQSADAFLTPRPACAAPAQSRPLRRTPVRGSREAHSHHQIVRTGISSSPEPLPASHFGDYPEPLRRLCLPYAIRGRSGFRRAGAGGRRGATTGGVAEASVAAGAAPGDRRRTELRAAERLEQADAARRGAAVRRWQRVLRDARTPRQGGRRRSTCATTWASRSRSPSIAARPCSSPSSTRTARTSVR